MIEPTDTEIAAWADEFLKLRAYNRPVAVQIAMAAAKWVRSLNSPLPWQREPLAEWRIVGMNHYHTQGETCLFVAMTKGGRCITAEGPNEIAVFMDLAQKARQEG